MASCLCPCPRVSEGWRSCFCCVSVLQVAAARRRPRVRPSRLLLLHWTRRTPPAVGMRRPAHFLLLLLWLLAHASPAVVAARSRTQLAVEPLYALLLTATSLLPTVLLLLNLEPVLAPAGVVAHRVLALISHLELLSLRTIRRCVHTHRLSQGQAWNRGATGVVLVTTVVSFSFLAIPGGMSILPRPHAEFTTAFRNGVTSSGSSTGFTCASMFRSALRARRQSNPPRVKSSTLTTVTAPGTLRFTTR